MGILSFQYVVLPGEVKYFVIDDTEIFLLEINKACEKSWIRSDALFTCGNKLLETPFILINLNVNFDSQSGHISICHHNDLILQSTLIYVNLLRKGGVFLQISGKFSECVLHASIHAKYWLHTLACDFLNSVWIAKLNLDRDMRTVNEC